MSCDNWGWSFQCEKEEVPATACLMHPSGQGDKEQQLSLRFEATFLVLSEKAGQNFHTQAACEDIHLQGMGSAKASLAALITRMASRASLSAGHTGLTGCSSNEHPSCSAVILLGWRNSQTCPVLSP